MVFMLMCVCIFIVFECFQIVLHLTLIIQMTLTVFTNVVLGVCYVLLNLQIHLVLLAVLTVF